MDVGWFCFKVGFGCFLCGFGVVSVDLVWVLCWVPILGGFRVDFAWILGGWWVQIRPPEDC